MKMKEWSFIRYTG